MGKLSPSGTGLYRIGHNNIGHKPNWPHKQTTSISPKMNNHIDHKKMSCYLASTFKSYAIWIFCVANMVYFYGGYCLAVADIIVADMVPALWN